jgi:SAM-dependent methyltransferase
MGAKKEYAKCLMRCGGTIAPVANIWFGGKSRVKWPVGICRECGHVQQAKLFETVELNAMNKSFFDRYRYFSEKKEFGEGQLHKLEALSERMKPFIGKGKGQLLDIGAGEGWATNFSREYGLEYHVVEIHPDLADNLEKKGAIIVAKEIEGLIPQWNRKFDVVFLRHVLEHLPDPIGDMGKISKCLGPEGLLYVALPNFLKGIPKAGFRVDYLRPVHISYFTPHKLEWVLHSAGLQIVAMDGNDGELWAIARHGDTSVSLENERDETYAHFKTLLSKYRLIDLRGIAKIYVSRLKKTARK